MYTKQSNFLDGSYANNNAYVRVVYQYLIYSKTGLMKSNKAPQEGQSSYLSYNLIAYSKGFIPIYKFAFFL